MVGPPEQPVLFVQQHPEDRRKNKGSVNASNVKSHVAKSYRFPKIKSNASPAQFDVGDSIRTSSLGLTDPPVLTYRLSADGLVPRKLSTLERHDSKTRRRVRLQHHEESDPFLSPPRPPPPLFHTMFNNRGTERSMVFQYYVTEWWPHGRQLGISSAIFGFTPIMSFDHQIVNQRVSSALHYPSTLSIEAILASASCRMQLVRNQPFSDPHLCETLYLQAIRSLRVRLGLDVPVDEQLILDISGLMYAEIFNKSGPPADVLWNLCKESIIKMGGFGRLSPMTALAALSTDFFVANAKLTAPMLNAYRCPELLGIHASDKTEDGASTRRLVHSRIAELDPRCQALVNSSHHLGTQFTSLWKLPSIYRTLVSLRTHRTRFAKNFRSPLSPSASSSSTKPLVPPQVLEADCQALQMKMWAFNTWLAYSSTTTDGTPVADAPTWAREAISFVWQKADAINALLIGTEWELRQDHLAWISAMGMFASQSTVDRVAYSRLLGNAAGRLGAKDAARLNEELSQHMPLEHMPGYDESLLESVF
ncbi:hypothetical protein H2200_010654 [Cladophialophora chaetospira]|uniref:Uncharacterized protein n=1 Tax=Cladophialophora chaetospira TaxID=386627 RepID=A0AA38X0I4_9EURO|nr:hypothetical protein H2200_010654 [Cladophialophora chaetospira]